MVLTTRTEATHAWLKLHPNFPSDADPLPLDVEEGLCQLVAHMFLQEGPPDGADHGPTEALPGGEPSDFKLRQYFQFCIETDRGVYGEGFRRAARAFARMGIQELLYYVALHRDFPPL